jgi:hypothetical protein
MPRTVNGGIALQNLGELVKTIELWLVSRGGLVAHTTFAPRTLTMPLALSFSLVHPLI